MEDSQDIAMDAPGHRDALRQVALAAVVWVIAFALMLCQPADRASGDGTARTDPARAGASR